MSARVAEKADTKDEANKNEDALIETESDETEAPATTNQVSAPGHGRLPHSAYNNIVEQRLLIAEFKAGDKCPLMFGGRLYNIEPGVLVRVRGQNLAVVDKYWIDKLRCALCSHLVLASVAAHVEKEKYDSVFKAILTLQKYYVAIPFYRQAYFQSLLGVPLPASTQWKLIEEVGGAEILILPALERMAANGDVIHNDDSHVKITDIIRHNRQHP